MKPITRKPMLVATMCLVNSLRSGFAQRRTSIFESLFPAPNRSTQLQSPLWGPVNGEVGCRLL